MKKFLIKFLLFLGIVFVIIYGIELMVPYYWGAPDLVVKMTFYKKHKDDFNTLFLGSSHVYRHVIPSLFDKSTMGKTHTFNFGVGAMGSLEDFAFYENLLKKDISPNVKYVFIELLPISNIPKSILHSSRAKYYLDHHTYSMAVEYFKTGLHAFPREKEKEIIENYTVAYRENVLNIGLVKEMLMFHLKPFDLSINLLGMHNDGFYSIEEEISLGIEENINFRQDSETLVRNSKAARAAYQKVNTLKSNNVYVRYLNQLIEKSNKRGIHLIFFLPVMLGELDYIHMVPIFNQLDEKHKIDLAHPDESSEFYGLDIYFDRGHFNNKGARLFTEKLALQFNRLSLKQNDI